MIEGERQIGRVGEVEREAKREERRGRGRGEAILTLYNVSGISLYKQPSTRKGGDDNGGGKVLYMYLLAVA